MRALSKLKTALIALGLAIGAAAPTMAQPSPEDLEVAATAELLATRYRLFPDAKLLAQTITDTDQRAISTAKILRAEASFASAERATELVAEARKVLAALVSDGGKLEYVEFLLRGIGEDGYPASLEGDRRNAEDVLNTLKTKFETQIQANPSILSTDFHFFLNYMRLSHLNILKDFVEIRMYRANEERSKAALARLKDAFFEMQFNMSATDTPWVGPVFEAFMLAGEASLVMAEPRSAIDVWMQLTMEMSNMEPTVPLVSYSALRAWLRITQVRLDEFGNDVKILTEAREGIAEALTQYVTARNSEQGKELQMLDVTAQIKLGQNIDAALGRLLALAESSAGSFRYRAATELASLALLDGLSNEQRVNCIAMAQTVGDATLNMTIIRALHRTLTVIKTAEEFERFAPFCYLSLGLSYESMGRYFDAANIFRQAAQRFDYWRSNPAWQENAEKLPGHFFNAAGSPMLPDRSVGKANFKLRTRGDAFELPRLFAERALNNAEFLASPSFGDNTNRDFQNLKQEISDWFSKYRGEEQRFYAVTTAGFEKARANPNLESAIYLLSAIPTDPSAVRASLAANGAILAELGNGGMPRSGSVSVAAFIDGPYTLDGVDFQGQMPRINTDFAQLPLSARDELRADLTAIKQNTDSREQAWMLAVYAMKRLVALQVVGDSGRVELAEGMSVVQLASAYAANLTQAMLQRNEEERRVSESVINVAKASFQAGFTLLQPQNSVANMADSMARKEARAAENMPRVVQWYSVVWNDAREMLKLELVKASDPSGARKTLNGMLQWIFSGLNDAGEIDAAAELFNEYREIFNDEDSTADVRRLATRLRATLQTTDVSASNAWTSGAAGARSFKGILARGLDNLVAATEYEKANGEGSFENLSLRERSNVVVAWQKNRLDSQVFRSEGPLAQLLTDAEREAANQAWTDLLATAEKIYANGIAAALTQLESSAGKEVCDAARAALAQGPDAAVEAFLGAAQANHHGFFRDLIGEHAPGMGKSFKAELGRYLEATANEFTARAVRRLSRFTRVLNIVAELNEKETGRWEPYDPKNAEIYGTFYITIAAINDTPEAWLNVERAYRLTMQDLESSWGDISYIATTPDKNALARPDDLARELRSRYAMGLASLKLAQFSKDDGKRKAYLSEANRNLQRCFNIVKWYNGVTVNRDKSWEMNLQNTEALKAISELYYGISDAYADLCMYYVNNNEKPDWGGAKFYDQGINPNKTDDLFYKLPETPLELLDEAAVQQSFVVLATNGSVIQGSLYDADYHKALRRYAALTKSRVAAGGEKDLLARRVAPHLRDLLTIKPYAVSDYLKEQVAWAEQELAAIK